MIAQLILQEYSDLVLISDGASQFQTWFLSLTEQFNSNSKGYHSLTIQVVSNVWREKNYRIFRDQREPAQRLMDELHDEAVL